MAIALIIIGIICLAVGVQSLRRWYKENAAGGVTARTSTMLMVGFFGATLGLLGGISMLFLD